MIKKCAVVNDVSGFGKCSISASLPIMAAMKVQACPVVTSVLSHQTAFDNYRIMDTSSFMDELIDGWKRNHVRVDAILTGFMANTEQIDRVQGFIDSFCGEDTVLVVDPVMGDDGEVYKNYTAEMCDKVRELSRIATLITPNAMELCILVRKEFTSDVRKLEKYAKSLLSDTVKYVAVTGIKSERQIGTLVVSKERVSLISADYHPGSYSGTGDIFASILTAALARGLDVFDAADFAAGFISECIRDTDENDTREGICFEEHMGEICEKFK